VFQRCWGFVFYGVCDCRLFGGFLFLRTNLQRKTTVNLATKEEIIAAIQRCASRLGRAPVYHELRLELKVGERWLQSLFGSYTEALAACGLRPSPRNAKAPLDALFRDWAGVARKVGKIPTRNEQDSYGEFTSAPLVRRFRRWNSVPRELRIYAEKHGLWKEWPDVLEMLNHDKRAKRACAGGGALCDESNQRARRRKARRLEPARCSHVWTTD
jgi:hypothetical protein